MNKKELTLKEEELGSICCITKGSDVPAMVLDGKIPQYVVYPTNDEEIARVLSLAAKTKTSIAIVGGESKFNTGTPLTDLKWALSTAKLKQDPVINADDLTVYVKAGVTLTELQNLLAQYNLFLPLEPGTAKTTVGGSLAGGGSSSHRLKYGLVRDFVLGMTVVLTDGKVYKFGGQTVKNVAGYDVRKLFIGSKGTLGVITEACLRVYPIPPSSKALLGLVQEQDTAWKVAKIIEEIQPTDIKIYDTPMVERLYNLDSQKNGCYAILVKYSGSGPTVDKQYTETLAVFNKYGISLSKIWENIEDGKILQQRNGIINILDDFSQGLSRIKISVPRVKAREMAQRLEEAARKFCIKKLAMHMPTVGICYVQYTTGVNELEFLLNFQGVVRELGGLVQVENGEILLRQTFRTGCEQVLDLQIKNFFDPEGVLNPGKCL